jgi:hypothetical protein
MIFFAGRHAFAAFTDCRWRFIDTADAFIAAMSAVAHFASGHADYADIIAVDCHFAFISRYFRQYAMPLMLPLSYGSFSGLFRLSPYFAISMISSPYAAAH